MNLSPALFHPVVVVEVARERDPGIQSVSFIANVRRVPQDSITFLSRDSGFIFKSFVDLLFVFKLLFEFLDLGTKFIDPFRLRCQRNFLAIHHVASALEAFQELLDRGFGHGRVALSGAEWDHEISLSHEQVLF